MAEPSLWKLLSKGAYDKFFNTGDESSLASYISELDLDDPETLEYLRHQARLVMSNEFAAVPGSAGIGSGINVLTGQPGDYRGQNLILMNQPQEEVNSTADWYNVNKPANLVDIFLDYTDPEDEGLYETALRPGGTANNWDRSKYPFHEDGNQVYDIAPFIDLQSVIQSEGFIEGPEQVYELMEQGENLYTQAMSLKEGEGFRIEEPTFWSSLDLGRTNWSIGKDEKGIYAAIADVWDFTGKDNIPGSILDQIGQPINMYSRFYLDRDDFLPLIFNRPGY
jgi:hypothetical protein